METTILDDYTNLFRREKPDLVMYESVFLNDESDVSAVNSSIFKNVTSLGSIISAAKELGFGPIVMYGRFGSNVSEKDKTEEIEYYLTWGKGDIADFIPQPFEPTDLLGRIGRLLSMPKPDTQVGDGKRVKVMQTDPSDCAWIYTLLKRNGYNVSFEQNSSELMGHVERSIETAQRLTC